MHRLWPEGFQGTPQDALLGKIGLKHIRQNFLHYLWFSVWEVLELHLPFVNGWGKWYNLMVSGFTGIVYVGLPFAFWKKFSLPILWLLLTPLYFTAVFALTDATPRYLVPTLPIYLLLSGIGYDAIVSTFLAWRKR